MNLQGPKLPVMVGPDASLETVYTQAFDTILANEM